MVSRRAVWTARMRLRWLVRVAAVCVGLANVPAVILWVGGLYVLGGEDASSLGEALPSVLAGLATSQIVLKAFELPGRSFYYRYQVVVISACLGGVIMGGLLGWLFALDGQHDEVVT